MLSKIKKNSTKHNLLSFSSLFFLLKKNEMYECYAMQILENKNKKNKTKQNETKEQWSQRVEQ